MQQSELAESMERNSKAYNLANRFTRALLFIYLIVLCWILLFKLGVRFSYMEKRSVNVIPFSGPSILTSENILNVLVFVPLGIYAGILFERGRFGNLLFFFLLSATIEGLQYLLRIGAFDVTDIITNTSGGIIGLTLFKTIAKAFDNRVRAQQIINIISAVGTVVLLLLLALLKLNLLPVRYR